MTTANEDANKVRCLNCGAYIGRVCPVCDHPEETKMDLKTLQAEVNDRWSQQLDNPCHTSADSGHALVHMTKALGKVASALNDAEHEKRSLRADEIEKYLADLVICAARFGNGVVDLDAACAARLREKFPKQLQHDTGPEGGRPCCRCGIRHSQATAYIPCFVEGDTLTTWQARHQQALDACPTGTINDILRST